jgi:hypothetical protein
MTENVLMGQPLRRLVLEQDIFGLRVSMQ